MGIRGPTYIAISPEATPDIGARWLKAVSAEVKQDTRGTLVVFEANLRPLWARFTAAPGLASTADLEAEMEMVVWLGQIGSDRFRLARSEELLDIAGNWDASAFLSDPDVLAIERAIVEELGADYAASIVVVAAAATAPVVRAAAPNIN
jgi:hypothetical protein